MVTYEQASSSLSYDPESGVIVWTRPPAAWIKPGAEAGTVHKDRKSVV